MADDTPQKQNPAPQAPAERALGMDNGGAFVLPAHLDGSKNRPHRPVKVPRPRPASTAKRK